jgi:hypothetical protein
LFHVPCSIWRFHGFSRQEATEKDKQAQTPQDAQENTLAATPQVAVRQTNFSLRGT